MHRIMTNSILVSNFVVKFVKYSPIQLPHHDQPLILHTPWHFRNIVGQKNLPVTYPNSQNDNIHRYLLCTKWKVATLLCIQIIVFHLSKHFSNTNIPWSQCVRIGEFRLYCMSFTYMWVRKPSSPELLNLSPPLLDSFHPQCSFEVHSSRNWTCAGQLNDSTCHTHNS